MKHYSTSTSREGLRLPYSGFIVGKLADALRLKAALREDFTAVSYKTVQRYFSGSRVKPDAVEQILDALVDSLVPPGLVLGKGLIEKFQLGLVVRSAIKDYARHWDRMAAEANVHMFEVTKARDLPMPILRLVALDLGIRVGGWAAIRLLKGDPIQWETTWLDGGELRRFIDEHRERLGLTVHALADKLGVSDQAVEAWRLGASLPTSNNIEALGKVLAGDGLRQVEVEYTVRVIVAIDQVRGSLKDVIGEDRLGDLVAGMKATAVEVEDIHRKILSVRPTPEVPLEMAARWDDVMGEIRKGMLRGAVWELPVHGARCEIGEITAVALVEKAKWRPEAAADFAVLPGDWSPRITYWLSHVGSADRAVEFMRHRLPDVTGRDADTAGMIAEAIIEGTLALGNMFWEPRPDMQMIRISPPPFEKAMNRVIQADRAGSAGNWTTAATHLRHAVQHQPQDAAVHLKLGAALWQTGVERRDMAMIDEGLLECRVAVQLAPEFGNARNEIGVILSNIGRHEEAEEAFAEAEPYHGQHNHHWFCRANNYLALGRLEDARTAFEKTIELTGNGEHVEAKSRLAATLMGLGKKREARNLGKQVHHITGIDPTDNWEEWLEPSSRQRTPPR